MACMFRTSSMALSASALTPGLLSLAPGASTLTNCDYSVNDDMHFSIKITAPHAQAQGGLRSEQISDMNYSGGVIFEPPWTACGLAPDRPFSCGSSEPAADRQVVSPPPSPLSPQRITSPMWPPMPVLALQ